MEPLTLRPRYERAEAVSNFPLRTAVTVQSAQLPFKNEVAMHTHWHSKLYRGGQPNALVYYFASVTDVASGKVLGEIEFTNHAPQT